MRAPRPSLVVALLVPLLGPLALACGSSAQTAQLDDAVAHADAIGTGGDGATGAHDAASAAIDPAGSGAYTPATQVVAIPGSAASSTIPTTIYTPTGAPSPHPLVVISPGFQLARTQYASYAQHLASWGFVVMLTDYADQSISADHQTMANDVSKVIDYALATPALAVDATKIATAGHSLGGDISVLAASGDARVEAVVGWDPVDATDPSVVPEHMVGLTAAVAVIGETTDGGSGSFACAPSAENFQQFYAAAGTPALAMTIDDASHMNWVDDPTCLVCGLCTAGTAPADRARTATRRLNVAWLRARLLGDATMAPWLTAPPEVAAGVATVVASRRAAARACGDTMRHAIDDHVRRDPRRRPRRRRMRR